MAIALALEWLLLCTSNKLLLVVLVAMSEHIVLVRTGKFGVLGSRAAEGTPTTTTTASGAGGEGTIVTAGNRCRSGTSSGDGKARASDGTPILSRNNPLFAIPPLFNLTSSRPSVVSRTGGDPAAGGGQPPKAASSSKKKSKKTPAPPPAATAATAAAPLPQKEWTDDLQRDYERILSVGEECISPNELQALLLAKGRGSSGDGTGGGFNLYDGFEPSGRMHIAQGVFKAMNVNKCTSNDTNGTFVFWVADWFALMNDKMGGDLDKIKIVGQYLIEVWTAAGMDLDHVVFKWASDEITQNAATYWPTMLDVARRFNITRIVKCCQIMGRLEGSLTAAQILYPLMQCTDVFFLKADICQLGVDQRKVNMLAREYCDAAGIKHKPIILSHHMLYGLKAGQEKMSKSDPDSAIFMEDTPEDVARKIQNAYCPSTETVVTGGVGQNDNDDDSPSSSDNVHDAGKESMHLKVDTLKNPCLDYVENIIFSPPNATFTAGSRTYHDFAPVRSDFLSGALSESDLKQGLIDALNQLLDPVRKHFFENPRAKELLSMVQQYKKEAPALTEKAVRRLDLVQLGHVPANCHLVLAPLPTANPTLQLVVDVLDQLQAGEDNNRPCVLFLSDWSARVCNACQADVKAIAAFYTILLAGLRALHPRKAMGAVTVVWQSEAILKDPSNYWISVINVGRHFTLDKVMESLKASDGVGFVIARLMQVADVAGVAPASLALAPDREGSHSVSDTPSAVVKSLVKDFFVSQLPGMKAPEMVASRSPSIRLQPARESSALVTENDEYYLLDDPKVTIVSWYCRGVNARIPVTYTVS